MSATDFWAASRAQSSSRPQHVKLTFGELTAYDPATHTGKFNLMVFADQDDPTGGTPIETPFIQIMTPWSGQGSGVQFQPMVGSQALVLFADELAIHPICGMLLFNGTDTPPFADGKSNGWLDPNNASITTTADGATHGDGAGAARLAGNKYTLVSTQGGHTISQDDIAQKILAKSAGGHSILWNDAGQILSIVSAGGHVLHLDDANQEVQIITSLGHKITLNDAASSQAIAIISKLGHEMKMDDIANIFSHVAAAGGSVNLGAVAGGLHPAIHYQDIYNMINDGTAGIDKLRLDDLKNVANAVAAGMAASGVPSAPGAGLIISYISGLTPTFQPPGSSKVNVAA